MAARVVVALLLIAIARPASASSRLLPSSSPYLVEHSADLVDWHPWGAPALDVARRERKPVFVFIGRAGCHECRTREREMLGDADVVELLARSFVAVVVDRDERPEVEWVHAAALGLPPSGVSHPIVAVLAPDGRPYFGAAGVERDDRDGRAGLESVLGSATALLRNDPAAVEERAARALAALREAERPPAPRAPLGEAVVDSALRGLGDSFDAVYGGFGLAPKRPPHAALLFLLEQHDHGRKRALEMVERTLDGLAKGALRDHVGGGFHRESADALWMRPRFEKTLADNALLLRTYALAHAASGRALHRRVAEEIAEWARRELADPTGAFRAGLASESDGVDGGLYRWSREQIASALEDATAAQLMASHRLAAEGLIVPLDPAAPRPAALDTLRAARARRPQPAVDERVFAGANGLMIGALAVSGRLLGRAEHVTAARAAATAVLERLAPVRRPPASGPAPSLTRWFRGDASGGGALLEDHAFLAQGLLDLYDADGDQRWLDAARWLADAAVGRFLDVSAGGFFETDAGHGPLLGRVRNGYDNDLLSGSGVMASVLLRLGAATGEPRTPSSRGRPWTASSARCSARRAGWRASRASRRLCSTLGKSSRGRPLLSRRHRSRLAKPADR